MLIFALYNKGLEKNFLARTLPSSLKFNFLHSFLSRKWDEVSCKLGYICMKCQSLFSVDSKKIITNFVSAEFAQGVLNVN